ncbi:class F sortase [Planobispora siamensis]|uniref:Class F sortase n=1 Tax=Planobispora siamensis TaxID=936338 RepID=A0A8J3SSL2_9ACTN|nr:class F sortase [Planobispora siamensis]GIH97960.1 class F sortase [Planobispora siamensis]
MATDRSPRARPLSWLLLTTAAIAVLVIPVAMAVRVLNPVGSASPALENPSAPTVLEPLTAAAIRDHAPDKAAATHATPSVALARSVPVRVKIPKIKLSAPIISVGVDDEGVVQVPPLNRPQQAGWYRHGPTPGEIGPAVILGHVDTTTGPAVFARLRELKVGDAISVTRKDGRTATFTIERITTVAKKHFPTSRVYGPLDYPGLRLITCDGDFESRAHSYTDNMIVYARLK